MNKVEEFLSMQETKKTKDVYKSHLKMFYKAMDFNWDDPDSYFDDGRDYGQDFFDYAQKIKGYAPVTRSARLNALKIFLEENDITISKKMLKRTTKKIRARPITIDEIPKPEELKSILSHGTVKDRALFLTLAHSGMRIGEALAIELDDIKWDNDPVRVYIRSEITKTKVPRVVFISKESADAIREWLKVREEWIDTAVKRTRKIHRVEIEKRVFPHQYNTAVVSWHRLLKKSKHTDKDKSTKIYRFHIHTLRKYFITRLKQDVRADIVEKIAGHDGYLAGAYDKLTVDELEQGYKKGMNNLLIFESQLNLSEVHSELKNKDERLHKQQEEIQEMKQEMQKLRMDLLDVKLKQVQELQRKEQNK